MEQAEKNWAAELLFFDKRCTQILFVCGVFRDGLNRSEIEAFIGTKNEPNVKRALDYLSAGSLPPALELRPVSRNYKYEIDGDTIIKKTVDISSTKRYFLRQDFFRNLLGHMFPPEMQGAILNLSLSQNTIDNTAAALNFNISEKRVLARRSLRNRGVEQTLTAVKRSLSGEDFAAEVSALGDALYQKLDLETGALRTKIEAGELSYDGLRDVLMVLPPMSEQIIRYAVSVASDYFKGQSNISLTQLLIILALLNLFKKPTLTEMLINSPLHTIVYLAMAKKLNMMPHL